MRLEDRVNLTFALLMIGITIFSFNRMKYAFIHLIVELTAIVLIIILCRSKNKIVRDWYSVIMVPLFFMNLKGKIEAVNPVCCDLFLYKMDRLILLGRDPFKLLEKIYNPLLNEILQIAYSLYFFVPVIAGLFLYKRDYRSFRLGLVTILITFYGSYLGYFTVPAVGPRFLLDNGLRKEAQGIFLTEKIKSILDTLEPTKFDCFPSGHTAVSLACLYVVRKDKRALFVLTPLVVGIIAATVYHRYHYIVDVIAGIILTYISVKLAEYLFLKEEKWLLK